MKLAVLFLLTILSLPACTEISTDATPRSSGAPSSTAVQRTATPANRTATPISFAPGDRVPAQVTRVVDGDTIHVSINGQMYTVRYIGIDTPETVAPDTPVEWMGPEASAANKRLVENKTILMEKDVSETDRYGRLLRYVYVGDAFVNAELVRQGYAQVATFPPDVKYQSLFLQLQREAREAGRGLWGGTPTRAPPK